MSYGVRIDFDDGSDFTLEDVFDTEDEADEVAREWASDYSQGGDYLREAGEEACDGKVIGWEIYEV